MALYHLAAQVISRSAGRSSVAAAAYRSGQVLTDERSGTECRYTRRQERVLHAEILAPAGAPAWARDRQTLWNRVEAAERRKDAQVGREVEVALPVELNPDQRLELVRDWTRRTFVGPHGLVADLAVHHDPDERNPHCHILLTTRPLEGDGFGPKARHLNERDQLVAWRESWAEAVNSALARAGHEARVDHRSLAEQGIAREPTVHEGWAARRIGATADRVQLNLQIRERNRQLELAAAAWDPEIGAQGPVEPEGVEAPRAPGGEGRRPSPGLEELLERARAAGAAGAKPQMQAPQARPGPIPDAQGPEVPPRAGKGRKRPPTASERLRMALEAVGGRLRDLITWPARRAAERRAEAEALAARRRFAAEGRVQAWRKALTDDPTLLRAPIDRFSDPHQGVERFAFVVDVRRAGLPMPSAKLLPQVWQVLIEVQDARDRERRAAALTARPGPAAQPERPQPAVGLPSSAKPPLTPAQIAARRRSGPER